MNEREYLEDQIHFLVELLTEAQMEEYMQFLKSNDYENKKNDNKVLEHTFSRK